MKITLLCAPSLDGYLAHTDHDHIDWTSREDKTQYHERTKQAGAVIMGANTWKVYGKTAPYNLTAVLSSTPEPDQEHAFFRSSAEEIVAELEKRGITDAALIGGGGANATFLAASLIDELYLTLVPFWFGGGIPLFAGNPSIDFELLDSQPLGPSEVLLHYRIKK